MWHFPRPGIKACTLPWQVESSPRDHQEVQSPQCFSLSRDRRSGGSASCSSSRQAQAVSASWSSFSSAWFCLAAQELKLYMEALHPPEGREAELSGIRCSQAVSLTTASLRPAQEDEVWPSFNSLTSDSGCCWRLILFISLWNPTFPSSVSASSFCSPASHPVTVQWLLPIRASLFMKHTRFYMAPQSSKWSRFVSLCLRLHI